MPQIVNWVGRYANSVAYETVSSADARSSAIRNACDARLMVGRQHFKS